MKSEIRPEIPSLQYEKQPFSLVPMWKCPTSSHGETSAFQPVGAGFPHFFGWSSLRFYTRPFVPWVQCGAPKRYVCWFITPNNYRYINLINHSYGTINQLSYLGGLTLYPLNKINTDPWQIWGWKFTFNSHMVSLFRPKLWIYQRVCSPAEDS